jgi:Heparinase II/III-like protein/Heparinase II/III N-terminus
VSRPGAGWYLRRLRRMSPAEVVHRVRDKVRRRRWANRQVRPGEDLLQQLGLARGQRRGRHAGALTTGLFPQRTFESALPENARADAPADAVAAVVAAADRVLDGTWTVFGVRRPDSADPDWFLDPLTGRRSPSEQLAFRVNYRDEDGTGNVKQVWEMSRHHHLTVLAAAWWLTGEERYAEVVDAQLRSWWRANPFLSGVHWTSGIEVGVRLISWVWIRRLLDDWPKVGDLFENDDDAVRQIAWHQEYLAGFVSRGSSANNHVLAEAAGQLAAASAFPWYAHSAGWRSDAAELLEREFAANTFPSGINRELATDYHRFVLELVLVAAVEAACSGTRLSAGTWQCLARMLDAGVAIQDGAGNPPRQGDGDEGRGLVVDDPERHPWAVALGAGTAVLGAAAWAPPITRSVQAAVLGALARPLGIGRGLDRPAERPSRFADAGLILLRSRAEDGPEIWCRCDAGPHGFLSIAAHAHADALSLELRHDGVEILSDPGTYCYHGEPEWRQYFRSTLAHNTLEVEGVDQAQSGGPFLWTTQPRSTTIHCGVGGEPVQTWHGRHDGYRRLDTPAVHERTVTLDSRERTLTVADTVQSAGRSKVRLSWHLGPEISVDLCVGVAELAWRTEQGVQHGRLVLPDALAWTAHQGEERPPRGWYSPEFGRRVPSTTLTGAGTVSSGVELVTVLQLPRTEVVGPPRSGRSTVATPPSDLPATLGIRRTPAVSRGVVGYSSAQLLDEMRAGQEHTHG